MRDWLFGIAFLVLIFCFLGLVQANQHVRRVRKCMRSMARVYPDLAPRSAWEECDQRFRELEKSP